MLKVWDDWTSLHPLEAYVVGHSKGGEVVKVSTRISLRESDTKHLDEVAFIQLRRKRIREAKREACRQLRLLNLWETGKLP